MRRISNPPLVTAAAIAVSAIGILAVCATLAWNASPEGESRAPGRVEAGMVVAVDPETGELGMPAPGELGPAVTMDEARAYARRIAAELITEHHPDGSETLIHDGRLADYSVVRIGASGTPEFVCVHGELAVRNALHDTAPAAREEK